MKKLLILLSIFMISTSCETPESSSQVIGYSVATDGERTDILAVSEDIGSVWATYIDAHNSRDLESIRALNAVDFSSFGPAGEVVEGTDAHIEFLTEWFDMNNPKWTILWSISNRGENSEGETDEYVTAGHQVTLSVDGNDITVYQVIDATISDGKIVSFNVFQQERGQPSSE
ncbi:nuclear transport factor 2 family protein [Flavobacteriaceae bacterium]|jgi:hypothetical protein|nr:nuclear transport factor 2 family protein [Flavobacteriaceae bacterium]MDA9192683.1 nuclear transport factor 2 family protein [Flavobacteriaceae bacterium]MDA9850800.1 nuclear transport factor 2 family protein [Flavobacteriaceae bacterium]MDC0923490.1 nuclear transport factor 2 family protein [Flavobacteriaceae bacterium]MDC6466208.1 nuclear transport factor 2 family protein [Flavobacteriaceae bacterium]|tara:strand:+ start:23 stop:541 length:519 start_codon:yes stop_codon:yes gene_type:complete